MSTRHLLQKSNNMTRKPSQKPAFFTGSVIESEMGLSLAEEILESDNESLDNISKDEEELAGLVFGNEVGFRSQLGRKSDLQTEKTQEGAGTEDEADDGGIEDLDDADLFFFDSGPSATETALMPTSDVEKQLAGEAPAWHDSDDDRLVISLAGNTQLRKLRVNNDEDMVSGKVYTERLRCQFERLNSMPEWAQPRLAKRRRRSSASSNSSIFSAADDSDFSTFPLARLMRNASPFGCTRTSTMKKPRLRPEVLDIQQTRPIPLTQPSAIQSLSFHPEWPLLLSSGLASTLCLHQIDSTAYPTPNPLLTSVHVKNMPIHTSAFLGPKGKKIIFSGRRKYFHAWDLESGSIEKVTRVLGHKEEQRTMEKFKLSPCGQYMTFVGSSKKGGGIINILNATTTQWIASMRIEGTQGVADFAWWSDGGGLTVVSKSGEVAEWSLLERGYIARWIDEGYAPTTLTLGGSGGPQALGGDRWVVIGSQSGIINIYDRQQFTDFHNPPHVIVCERPQPTKSFDQFTRPISNIVISPDGQLLAFTSKWAKDALKLVHLNSCTVYRNWPTDRTPLGKITAVAFAPNSDVLAVGNAAGKVRLWEIRC